MRKSFTFITSITTEYEQKTYVQTYICNHNIVTADTVFFPEPPVMPLGKPAPLNKRKKLSKIITDLSHINQDGKAGMNMCSASLSY